MTHPRTGDTVTIDYVLKRGDGEEVGTTAQVGPRREEAVQQIPRSDLPPGPDPQPGMALQAQRQDGSPMMLHITEVTEDTVTVDGNHPLAGEDLTFDITLRAIKPAA